MAVWYDAIYLVMTGKRSIVSYYALVYFAVKNHSLQQYFLCEWFIWDKHTHFGSVTSLFFFFF